MKTRHRLTRRTGAALVLATTCALAFGPQVQAQSYGPRSSQWIGTSTGLNPFLMLEYNSWFDARNWDEAVPDAYTNATVSGSSVVSNHGFTARAAQLTIYTSAGGMLEIQPGGQLEITGETNTPAGTRRYDEMMWLGSHNSASTISYNVLYAQQSKTITDQLEDGVRGLLLDVHKHTALGASEEGIYLCHGEGLCDVPFNNPNTFVAGNPIFAGFSVGALATGLVIGCTSCAVSLGTCIPCCAVCVAATAYVAADAAARMPVSHALDEIRDFLEGDPDAIITIYFEDYLDDDYQSLWDEIVDAGLDGYAYDPLLPNAAQPLDGGHAPDGNTHSWPSLEWMKAANKRLVLFVTSPSGVGGSDGNAAGHLLRRNAFGNQTAFTSVTQPCENSGKPLLDDKRYKLYLMNHFNEITDIPSYVFDEGDNEYCQILDRIEADCCPYATRYPTMLAVDFYEAGDPIAAVQYVNSRWRPDQPDSCGSGCQGAPLAAGGPGEGGDEPASSSGLVGASSTSPRGGSWSDHSGHEHARSRSRDPASMSAGGGGGAAPHRTAGGDDRSGERAAAAGQLAGCGAGVAPGLAVSLDGGPRSLEFRVTGGPPGLPTSGMLMIGAAAASPIPLGGGCFGYVEPSRPYLTLFIGTDERGVGWLGSFEVPREQVARGLELAAQVFLLDPPTAGPNGYEASNGVVFGLDH